MRMSPRGRWGEDWCVSERATPTRELCPAPDTVSNQIERWLASEGDKTLGGLIDVFQEKSFALIFVLLLGVPALPLPTGGATHVFEIIAMLVALQLVVGRDKIWLPERWRKVELGTGGGRTRFLMGLTKAIAGSSASLDRACASCSTIVRATLSSGCWRSPARSAP